MSIKKELFQQVRFKNLTLKNRFVRSAVWMQMASEEGHLTPELVDVYKKLADGGVGLIITGYAYIDINDQPNSRMIGMYDDTFIPEWKEVIDYVHKKGAKIALQIASGGSQTYIESAKHRKILAASAVLNRVTGILPEEMTKEDITHLIETYKQAALRAKQTGFDAIQIHAAHGYLLSQFLTPYYNRRTDEYGGTLHNRARLIYEIFSAIRSVLGCDFPIMIKLNFDDFMDNGEGLTFPESIEMFKHLDTLGVDFIEPSGTNESSGRGLKPAFSKIAQTTEKQSYFSIQVAQIAEQISTPIILVGGNRNIEVMGKLLNETNIQLFSLARTLFAEPYLINRWKENPDYIPKCIACNRCWDTTPNSCILNRKTK
ncbi:NADH:flavin oxidoreductase [Bacteroides helcogenes]|uniref:NADH:flavin oxidoreductase/NADH oxidase n=1 Tax=Bacteroides helcogenes (strain ATCC 35417 / DSM 20613 / JCM 6297 / CCUG 15421 / P 36-108) TaxID=693979 RepID=E6SQN0_BACT6|nr:NADH:flavin oxidoreductase [Bacteroides helcogenes]ADV43004.1 NADH:flavin oxidoreductase/NADH oxidase [Bacteroides helcogenes P 36-108]MDY5236953.1 NADH:flavin oxidoreductase [Bacteroides helcogenes]